MFTFSVVDFALDTDFRYLIYYFMFQVSYQIGEVFVSMSQTDVQEALEKNKAKLTAEVEAIEEKAEAIKAAMSDLKTHLYAKFGNSINLEADEE